MRYKNRNWPTSSKLEIKRASLISHPLSLILELFGDEQGHPGILAREITFALRIPPPYFLQALDSHMDWTSGWQGR